MRAAVTPLVLVPKRLPLTFQPFLLSSRSTVLYNSHIIYMQNATPHFDFEWCVLAEHLLLAGLCYMQKLWAFKKGKKQQVGLEIRKHNVEIQCGNECSCPGLWTGLNRSGAG